MAETIQEFDVVVIGTGPGGEIMGASVLGPERAWSPTAIASLETTSARWMESERQ